MSSHKEQVGEWIRVRRDELRIPGRRLADLAGISYKTITGAETGRTEIRGGRAAVEDVLGWQRGDLTRAYKYGLQPRAADEGGEQPTPPRHRTHAEILATADPREQHVLVHLLAALREQYGQTGDMQAQAG